MKMVGQELLAALRDGEAARPSRPCKAWSSRYDYSEHGGAPLLGIDGICIICHGSSGDRAIENALEVAARYVARPAQRAHRRGAGTSPALASRTE